MSHQQRLQARLRQPGTGNPESLRDGRQRAAGRRFDVYRNNVAHSLIGALKTGFAATYRQLGDAAFTDMARAWWPNHLPQSPRLPCYGESFPDFIAMSMAQSPWIASIARIDWAMRSSYHAADHEAIDPGELARIAPETLMTCGLRLAPSLRLLPLDWAVLEHYWSARSDAPFDDPPASRPQAILITRSPFDPEAIELNQGGAAFVTALYEGEPLGSAYDKALDADADFDLAATLQLLFQKQCLTEIVTDD
ncbi:DNA-binding domain-containing protein [Gammaproteobacteria bacterium]|nr:DNA-binding domain-containing protein [Gammaproteobacteria bacterium]